LGKKLEHSGTYLCACVQETPIPKTLNTGKKGSLYKWESGKFYKADIEKKISSHLKMFYNKNRIQKDFLRHPKFLDPIDQVGVSTSD